MSPAAIDEMEPTRVSEAVFFRMRYDEKRDRRQWEQARVISYFAIAAHLKKGSVKSHQDLFKLSWDGENVDQKTKPITAEDFTAEQRERIIKDLRKDGF